MNIQTSYTVTPDSTTLVTHSHREGEAILNLYSNRQTLSLKFSFESLQILEEIISELSELQSSLIDNQKQVLVYQLRKLEKTSSSSPKPNEERSSCCF